MSQTKRSRSYITRTRERQREGEVEGADPRRTRPRCCWPCRSRGRAAIRDDGGATQGCRSGDAEAARRRGTSRRLQRLPDRIGLGFVGGFRDGDKLWRACPRLPPLLFIVTLRDGSPQPLIGWAPPIRAREGCRLGHWTESGGDQSNNLLLDLTLQLDLRFLFLLSNSSQISV